MFLSAFLSAQHGDYFVRNYLPKEYYGHANNYTICQNNNLILVANSNGIITFDGFNWKISHVYDELSIYNVYSSSDNKIYYSLENNDFGLFEKQNKGNYVFTSLLENLKDSDRPSETIRQIFEFQKAIYFLSADKLIELKNGSFKAFSPVDNFNLRPLKIGKHLFLVDINNQVFFLQNGVLTPVKNSQHFANYRSYFTYKITGTKYAIGCREVGMYIANYDSLNPSNTTFSKINAPCNKELIDCEVLNGITLNDGNLIFTSNKLGAFIINKNLEVINRFNTRTGLYENNVKSAFQDNNGNIWLPTYYGISYIEKNTPLLKYGRENGILGPVSSAVYFQEKLFIATDKGVQVFNPATNLFEELMGFNKQTWHLLNLDKKLFISTAKGVFVYDGKTIIQLNDLYTTFLIKDPLKENVFYSSTNKGIFEYEYKNKAFSLLNSYDLGAEVKTITTDVSSTIYFSTETKGIYFLDKYHKLDSIQKPQGLPDDKYENFLFKYKNDLLIGTSDGIYTLLRDNGGKVKCIKDARFYQLTKKEEIFRAVSFNESVLCSKTVKLDDYDKYEKKFSYFNSINGNIIEDNSGISKLSGVKPNLITYDSAQKTILIAADEGLYLLHHNYKLIEKKYHLYLSSIINKSKNENDTLLQNCNSTQNFSEFYLTIPFKNNGLEFKFGYNCYENSEVIDFSYWLEGKDDDYGKWLKTPYVNFSNLFEGDYKLHIKAKNEVSNDIIQMEIPFTILPPWYRSIWAYLVYVSLFILVIVITVKLNARRLIAKNLKLEEIISQRTATIEEQVHLLEHQKKDITDSINYAQRIQQSILPSIDEVKKFYESSFIFFQPKDIVSGDFYWFKKTSECEFLIACADCTGHGVPGAFMSMICSDKLTEASKQTHNPAEILFFVNNGIKNVLKQNISNEINNRDGMEIALVKYNYKTKELVFAGANRPLWLVKTLDNSLVEVKPTKASIASFTEYDFEYSNNYFSLNKGDMIYLSSDGYADQFGGSSGKKLMSKNMKSFFLEIMNLDINEQQMLIDTKINDWKGNYEQVDDLLVIGFRA